MQMRYTYIAKNEISVYLHNIYNLLFWTLF